MKIFSRQRRKVERYAGLFDSLERWLNGKVKSAAIYLATKTKDWTNRQQQIAFWAFVGSCCLLCGWTLIENLLKLIK